MAIDGVAFTIEGLDELLAKLDAISYDLKQKGGRASLRRAANIIRDAAKRSADAIDRADTENSIPANIKIQWGSRTFKKTGDLLFRVGVDGGAAYTNKNKGAKRKGGDTFYWRFIEFGTQKMQARPFMRPAIKQNQDKATQEFIASYIRYIDRAIKKGKR